MTQFEVHDAIRAAQQVAANLPAPITRPALERIARARTLDEVVGSAGVGVGVEVWASIDSSSFRINNAPVPQLVGRIKPADIKFPYMVRFNVGTGTKFARSYDGVREAQSGRSWADVVALAQATDPKCSGAYDAAEVPLTLDDDLVCGDRIVRAGQNLGFTTPITGFRTFMTWAREARMAFGCDGEPRVVVAVETRTKAGVRPWGIPVVSSRGDLKWPRFRSLAMFT